MGMQAHRHFRLVSLYSGAGGMDYGFEAAGFETSVAVEIDHACCETLRANRPWPVLEKNIHDTASQEILEAGKLKQGEVDLLIGGPPCQPFSKSAYWVNGDTKRLNDPRARTLDEYMRCVEDLLPESFVLENVYGISYSGKEEGFNFIKREIARINKRQKTNYTVSWRVINTANYGVPQIRERFFLVGHRDGKHFTLGQDYVCRSVRVVAPADGILTVEALSTQTGVHPPLEVEKFGGPNCCSERMGNPTSIQVTAGTEVVVNVEMVLGSPTSQSFTLNTSLVRQ
jgi:DNA-cytosine methyltransferase